MLTWNDGMYMDEKVEKNPERYRAIIEDRKFADSCHCISLPANPLNIMDIYSSRELWFEYRACGDLEIIGLAKNREAVMRLAAKIVEDVYSSCGEISPGSVRSFFKKPMKRRDSF